MDGNSEPGYFYHARRDAVSRLAHCIPWFFRHIRADSGATCSASLAWAESATDPWLKSGEGRGDSEARPASTRGLASKVAPKVIGMLVSGRGEWTSLFDSVHFSAEGRLGLAGDALFWSWEYCVNHGDLGLIENTVYTRISVDLTNRTVN